MSLKRFVAVDLLLILHNLTDEIQGAERGLTIACCCLVGLTLILRMTGRLQHPRRGNTPGTVLELRIYRVDNSFWQLTFGGLATAELIAIERGVGTHVDAVLYYI
ncbi:hypothetical protein VTN00DRAFT_6865 [Thermoascus crustaceus]|uniref:uncharacterized protein n=1 Tax=Thermoascus crustaceus TaxID=5088 RepID=UPI003743EEC5